MSSWVVAALILNAVLVAAAIVFAVRIASRSTVVALGVELQRSPAAVSAVMAYAGAGSRPPLFRPAQMRRTEWRALVDAFEAARAVYVSELIEARTAGASVAGSLTRATHDFEVAKRRLNRFELEVCAGSSDGRR
jgi:methylaspartate ammonia-lyase